MQSLGVRRLPKSGRSADDVLDYVEDHLDHPWIAQSLQLLCSFCYSYNSPSYGFEPVCNHLGRNCLTTGASFNDHLLRQCQQVPQLLQSSTKVEALVKELLDLPKGQKR